MSALDNNADSEWLQDTIQASSDFGGHFFLNLKPFCINVDETSQLRNSNNSIARKIADMNAADDRRDMVLAMGFESDIAQYHDLVVATHFFECPLQIFARIFKIARKRSS
jgi:hypothetical protein